MSKYALISLLLLCASLPSTSASAFMALDKAVARPSTGPTAIQVRKHCKSKQSRCHAFRHNF